MGERWPGGLPGRVFEYDANGVLLRSVDPLGRSIERVFDELENLTGTRLPHGTARDFTHDVLSRLTGPDGLAVDHELVFDRCGRLTSRTRGSQGLSWEYDSDGHRTSFTDAYGTTTTYARDAAGQITAVGNPLLGEASFSYDAAGRMISATAGDLVQEWAYRNGALSEHVRSDRSGSGAPDVTMIGRDDDGRITALTRSGAVTRYGYDGAGQMVSAATTRVGEAGAPAVVLGWEYDAGGRLSRETVPGGSRVYGYDAAGQLLSVMEPDGSRTEFVHDGLGRRPRLIGPDGSWTEYAWGPTGLLAGSVVRDRDGAEVSRHSLWVDALGELAAVDRCELWWDTANSVPVLAGIGGGQVLSLPGGVTGMGEAWAAPGWRAARPTDQADPWAVVGAPTVLDPTPGGVAGGFAGVLPAGVTLTGNGGVDIAGLEWLGARAYDPVSRGFLSTDPLAPVLGAGWDGNPYAYAGNNPLNTTDPTGLRPLTDAELKAYDSSAGGALAAAGNWLGDNWEYIVAGAAVVAGVALMFTGVGGPVGMALIGAAAGALTSGGASAIVQKATSGSVDMNQVLQDAAIGAVGGGVGGAAGGLLARGANAARVAVSTGSTSRIVTTTNNVLRSSVVRSSLAAGTGGSGSNIVSYALDDDVDQTLGGYVSTAGPGFVTAAGGSALFSRLGTSFGNSVANRLPGWTGPVSSGGHSGAPYNWGSVITEDLTNRVGGAVVGYANTSLQPGGATGSEIMNGTIQGFTNGATGPSSGRRASGW